MSKMLNYYEMPVTYGPDDTDWDYTPDNNLNTPDNGNEN